MYPNTPRGAGIKASQAIGKAVGSPMKAMKAPSSMNSSQAPQDSVHTAPSGAYQGASHPQMQPDGGIPHNFTQLA